MVSANNRGEFPTVILSNASARILSRNDGCRIGNLPAAVLLVSFAGYATSGPLYSFENRRQAEPRPPLFASRELMSAPVISAARASGANVR